MESLWAYIDKKKWHADTKHRVALLIVGTVFALIGLAVWLVIRIWTLSTWGWMLCFVGYPFIIAWFVGIRYSYSHQFHNGKCCR